MFLCFFFQAEDGIRDIGVTGVQTCALPIFTRIGRVTGLDRIGLAGIEVACAIRPRGHVLQVSNGKGWTFRHAVQAALSEAAELEACETPDPVDLRWASAAQMRRRFGDDAVWSIFMELRSGV